MTTSRTNPTASSFNAGHWESNRAWWCASHSFGKFGTRIRNIFYEAARNHLPPWMRHIELDFRRSRTCAPGQHVAAQADGRNAEVD